MLKKGQPGWIDNAHPVDVGPQIEEELADSEGWLSYRRHASGMKRFGIKFKKKKPWRWSWKWSQWYRTEKARDEAMRCIEKKNDYVSKYYEMEAVTR